MPMPSCNAGWILDPTEMPQGDMDSYRGLAQAEAGNLVLLSKDTRVADAN